MALIDLSGYKSVESAVFVKMSIDGYGDFNVSTYRKSYTIGSDTYAALGNLMTVTEPSTDLTTGEKKITLTITGIPASNRSLVNDYEVKASPIQITRAFFDPDTGAILAVSGNPAVRFKGIITNFGFQQEWDSAALKASTTIVFECASNLAMLRNSISGRQTNPTTFPADRSFDRIPQLSNNNFNFGGVNK